MGADYGLKMQSSSRLRFYHHVCRHVMIAKRRCLTTPNIVFRILCCHFRGNLKEIRE
jgi:hypothetical protein